MINREGSPVGHVYWFNPSSLSRLAAETGFRVARLRNRGNLIPYLPKWLFRTMYFLFGTDPHSGRLIRWYPVRILWALIINGWLSESLNKVEYMYAFLVKAED